MSAGGEVERAMWLCAGGGSGEDRGQPMWFGEGSLAERGVVERGGGVVEWGGREWEGEGGGRPCFTTYK